MSGSQPHALAPSDSSHAVSLAARAFADDPLFRYIYPDPASRERRFAREHAAYLRWIYRPVGLAETVGDVDGLALWLLPESFHQLGWREAACLPALVRSVGVRRLPVVWRTYKAFDPFYPTDVPFHYLGLLAVEPEAQGKGLGSALLRAGLARADAQGVGTYLETSTEANVAFYRAHGFDIRHEIPLPDGAPTHVGMWRPPGAG
ncbi:MAG: GNAT family N-acetyltransferase [Bacteroidota bacterium]